MTFALVVNGLMERESQPVSISFRYTFIFSLCHGDRKIAECVMRKLATGCDQVCRWKGCYRHHVIMKVYFGRQIIPEEAVKVFLSLHNKKSKSEESDI